MHRRPGRCGLCRAADAFTNLMFAAQNGHTATVQALLQARAQINQKSMRGDTALRLAEARVHTDIADILRKAGAESSSGFLNFFS